MARSEHGTRAASTYERIRSDILAGRLQPGERLKFPELCTRYAVGVGAVREALTRLVEQGFIRSQAHAGFHVTPLSTDDLVELTEARVEIEQLVLRLSIERGDITWKSDVVAKHYALEHTPQYDKADPNRVSDAWAGAHREFHAVLLSGCRNTRLTVLATNLRDSASLYQAWSQQIGREPNRDVVAEHRELMDLTLAADLKAIPALARHIRRTTEILLGNTDKRFDQAIGSDVVTDDLVRSR